MSMPTLFPDTLDLNAPRPDALGPETFIEGGSARFAAGLVDQNGNVVAPEAIRLLVLSPGATQSYVHPTSIEGDQAIAVIYCSIPGTWRIRFESLTLPIAVYETLFVVGRRTVPGLTNEGPGGGGPNWGIFDLPPTEYVLDTDAIPLSHAATYKITHRVSVQQLADFVEASLEDIDLSSPPPIGDVAPNTGRFTALEALAGVNLRQGVAETGSTGVLMQAGASGTLGWTADALNVTPTNFARIRGTGTGANLSIEILPSGTGSVAVTGKGSFSGVLTAPTATVGTNTTQVATTAFVTSAVATVTGAYLPLTGGTLTGPLTLGAVAFETDNNTAATTAHAARVAGYAATVLPDANTTLTAAQTSGRVVNLAGTLTAQRTVTVPVAGNRKSWVFRNSTTGGFNVVIVAPGGGSYAIPPNTAAEFYTDGSLLFATHSLLPNSALRIGDGVRNAVLVTAGTALTTAATIASTGSGGIQFASDVSVANLTVTGTVTLPAAAKTMPVVFPFGGKPASGALVNVPMAFSVTVGVSLAGSMAFASTRATSNTVFTLNKVSPTNVVTQLGLITMGSGSNMMAGASGTGGSLGLGDTLQLVSPVTQDATLADIGITILCTRV